MIARIQSILAGCGHIDDGRERQMSGDQIGWRSSKYRSAQWQKRRSGIHMLLGVVMLSLSFTPLALSDQPADPYVDPPAITVHPSHNDVVLGKSTIGDMIAAGKKLFKTVFNSNDGVGRPGATGDSKPTVRLKQKQLFHRLAGPDASSCVDCHNQPVSGGSGGFATNAFVGAHFTDPPTNTITADITSERNTLSIFGAGPIEALAYEMTEILQATRKQALITAARDGEDVKLPLRAKGVSFGYITAHPDQTYDASGIQGVDMDLVVKPFGVKGVAVSLREFTNFALNQHHGIQSQERFGWARTGIKDFDEDGVDSEFSVGQMSALVLYQASLPPPSRIAYREAALQQRALEGEATFQRIGCSSCHIPRLPLQSAWFLEPNPYNRPGSIVPTDVAGQIMLQFNPSPGSGLFRDENGQVWVAAFTDLKRHVICDEGDLFFCNEKREQDFVPIDMFLTSKLWDAGSSAPYGHRGDLTTLDEAILHHSGEAKEAKNQFIRLSKYEKLSVIFFLQTMRVDEDPPK